MNDWAEWERVNGDAGGAEIKGEWEANYWRLKICFKERNNDPQLKPQNGFKSNLETIYFHSLPLGDTER